MSKLYLHCLALSSLLAATAFAQQNESPALSTPPVSAPKSTEGRIHLDVVVTDKSGKPVTGLEQSDFTLLDNGQPSKILSFKAIDGAVQMADPPVEVILVIDGVNLVFQGVANECQQIKRFLHENGGHLAQPVSIFVLTGEGLNAGSQSSVDGNALATEVGDIENNLRTRGPRVGNDGVAERFKFSVQALSAIAENQATKSGRKLLIWIGPGWPMFDSNRPPAPSNERLQSYFKMIVQLSTQLREARTSVYSVSQRAIYTLSSAETGIGIPQDSLVNLVYQDYLKGVKTVKEANTANLTLNVLAIRTGGRILPPDNDLSGQIDRCVKDAAVFYTLLFDPPRADRADEYHDLKLQIDKPKLTVHTHAGYYNQPATEPSTAEIQPGSDSTDHPPSSDPQVDHVAESAAKAVTVAQLEQMLKELQGQPDADAAKQLSGLVLTERLGSVRLSAWKSGLAGVQARQALVALADVSAFLSPPAEDIPANAPPDLAAQRQIMARAIDYLKIILPRLADFIGTRQTAHYEDTPQKSRKSGTENASGGQLHLKDTSSASVFYRDGHEVVQTETAPGKKAKGQAGQQIVTGTFGPILSVVIKDAANGTLTWSRWEHGAQGSVAVFRFAVPRKASHCFANNSSSQFFIGIDEFQQPIAYHGEMAVDPVTGTILRLVMETDFEPGSPMLRAYIMVEYGPVEIGGKTYFYPVRRVSLSKGPSSHQIGLDSKQTLGPPVTMLDDVTFGDYHMFRSEVKLLSPDDPLPDAK